MTINTLTGFAIASALLVSLPALAAPGACVPNNRIASTRVIDAQTIVVTDKDNKPYTVHMHGACIGLDQSAINLSFRTKTQLGCLSPGDTISYSLPGDKTPVQVRPNLQTPCVIDSVTAGGGSAR